MEKIAPEFQELQDKVGEWADKTFGEKTSIHGTIHHLQEEVKHLAENPYSPQAYADVQILFMSLARKVGFTMDDIYLAVEAKHEINVSRIWESPDEQGIIRHKTND